MAGFLAQFYRDLRDDYLLNANDRRDSFLFQYLKQEQQAGGRKTGSCGQLETAFAAAGDEAGRRAYLLLALELLEKSKKPLLATSEEAQGAAAGRELLLAYARRTGCPGAAAASRWDRRICRALLEQLRQAEGLPAPEAGLVETLHRELVDSLLQREAEDYLYNLGHGRKGNRDMAILEAYLENRYGGASQGGVGPSAGLEFYYRKGSRSGQLPSGEEVAQLQQLYEALQQGGYSEALVPICIDGRTGAGLYFMGTEYLREARLAPRGPGDVCRIACLYLQDLELLMEGSQATWSIWSGPREKLEEMCSYRDVEEALTWYGYLLEGGPRAPDDLLAYFQNGNNYPPPGCPPAFLRYFLPPRKARPVNRQALVEEGRPAFLAEPQGPGRRP